MRESSLYTFWGPNAVHLGEVKMLRDRDLNPLDELGCALAARDAIARHVPPNSWNSPVDVRDIHHVVITGNHPRVVVPADHLTDDWRDAENARRDAELLDIVAPLLALVR